jgi:hypothetical protein
MKVNNFIDQRIYDVDTKDVEELLLKIKNSFAGLESRITAKDYTITRASIESYTDDDEEAYMTIGLRYSHEVEEDYFVKKQEQDRQNDLKLQRRTIENILFHYPELRKEITIAAPEKI